jgi:hypothetical protein
LIFIAKDRNVFRPDPECFYCKGSGFLERSMNEMGTPYFESVIPVMNVMDRPELNGENIRPCHCLFPRLDRFDVVLQLQFDDTVFKEDENAFTRKHASIIKQMVKLQKWKSIWVVCGEGISRSPAVAIALDEHLNKRKSDLIKQYPCYNPYVYGVLAKKLGR